MVQGDAKEVLKELKQIRRTKRAGKFPFRVNVAEFTGIPLESDRFYGILIQKRNSE